MLFQLLYTKRVSKWQAFLTMLSALTIEQNKTQPICKREYVALFDRLESSNKPASARSVSPTQASPGHTWQ